MNQRMNNVNPQFSGMGMAYGKFGELLQGALPGINNNFLVSLPITKISFAYFTYDSGEAHHTVCPAHKHKALTLMSKMLDYFGIANTHCKLTIESELPEGKGLGSSTADLIATARAIESGTQKQLPLKILLQFLSEIEPSDAPMFDDIICFYHRQVKLHSQLGKLSNLAILGIDEGGIIDTIEFNKKLSPYTESEKTHYAKLLTALTSAVQTRDIATIGKISTESALLHQKSNPKKHLNDFIELASLANAAGIIVAHSGTYIGILLDKAQQDYFNQVALIEQNLKAHSLNPTLFDVYVKT